SKLLTQHPESTLFPYTTLFRSLRQTRREKLGMVFQRFALFPHRTILENAEFGLEIQNVPKEERQKKAKEALGMVGLGGYLNQKPDRKSTRLNSSHVSISYAVFC